MIEVSTVDNRIHRFTVVSGFDNERSDFEIYWSYKPTKAMNAKNFLARFAGDCQVLELELDGGDRRVFFQLVDTKDKKVQVLGHRRLPIRDMINFRDLGGYPAADGKRIRWGLLYRSDYFWNLKDEGEAFVRGLGIKTIIDYRNDEEVKSRPNRDIGVIKQLQCDPGAVTAEISGEMQSRVIDGDTEMILVERGMEAIKRCDHAGLAQMLEQQRRFVTDPVSKQAFRQALQILTNPQNLPADQHCRGGKDRTGFGVALVLAALGVSEEVILYDYMLTKEYRKERNAYLLGQYKEKSQDAALIDYLYSYFDIKEEFMEESFAEIKKNYDNILDYIKIELNIPEAAITTIRQYCLEK